MSAFPLERLFAMPAFEGLRVLRTYMTMHGCPDLMVASDLVERIEPDAHSLDLDAAQYLASLITPSVANGGAEFYRACIEAVLLKLDHPWSRIITLGRTRFTNKLRRDELSLFRNAGLLEDPASDDVAEWWAGLFGSIRQQADQKRNERARNAERLTLKHEAQRLSALGIPQRPKWMSLEDNTVGYDVLSYEPGPYGITNRLIEVKSSVASPLRFYVTRNEWEAALRFGDAFVFHIWNLATRPPELHIRTVKQVQPHVPADNKKGRWQNAEFPVTL